jgi:hypothetical protein
MDSEFRRALVSKIHARQAELKDQLAVRRFASFDEVTRVQGQIAGLDEAGKLAGEVAQAIFEGFDPSR